MTVARPEYEVRHASEEDRPFLEEVFLRAGREMITAARGAWDEERERRQFQKQLDLPFTWIVRHQNQDVGFMMVVIGDVIFELHTVCILPEWQNRGLGTAVTQDVVDVASQVGRGVELSVLKANPRARKLYEQLGFEVVRETENHHRMRFTGRVTPNESAGGQAG